MATQIETVEGEFTVPSDGHKLYTKTWKTTGTPKAILIFIHGFSDHCNAYNNFFTNMASQKQIEVRSFDQRGWGRSVHKKSQRGVSGGTSTVLSDLTAFIDAQLSTRSSSSYTGSSTTNGEKPQGHDRSKTNTNANVNANKSVIPVFLMGHSMGGNEVISWLGDSYDNARSLKVKSQIRGFLIQAPFIRDTESRNKPHSKISLLFLRNMARIAPHFQVVHKLEPSLLCRDPAENESFVNDPLSHDTGTLQGLWGLTQRATTINSGKLVINGDVGEGGVTRLWFGHGTADGFCEYKASAELVQRSVQVKDITLRSYEGGYHQLHAEPSPDKETFLDDVSGWILARSGPLSGLSPA